MDEPFASLDVQTRQIMENELLVPVAGRARKTVLFITHDLEEAIALVRPRGGALERAGTHQGAPTISPSASPRRGRDRLNPEFMALYRRIWGDLREEVMKHGIDGAGGPGHGA